MSHDQLFKELLEAFFREFMELFFPEVASRLDFSTVTFLNKETFTDLPQGEQRVADLVARVNTLEGVLEIILTHIEVEGERRYSIRSRMCDYYRMLMLRHRIPILPIVVYLSGGAGGLVMEEYEEFVLGIRVNTFRYQAVGLPDLSADDYLEQDNVLATALSALMKTSRLGRVAQKYQSLRALAQSRIDDARKALLSNVVETYLKLGSAEQAAFSQLVSQPEGKEIVKMVSVYEQRGMVIGKRDALLMLIQDKFGDSATDIRARIERIDEVEELDRLIRRVMYATTIEDIDLA